MTQKVTQDSVSELYASVYNHMKQAIAEADIVGKHVKFEMGQCSKDSRISDIMLNLCIVDAAKRMGVAEKTPDAKFDALVSGQKEVNKDTLFVTIPCPVLVGDEVITGNKRYDNLDPANMVKIAAEVYQISNADKGAAVAKHHMHALNFAFPSQSLAVKP